MGIDLLTKVNTESCRNGEKFDKSTGAAKRPIDERRRCALFALVMGMTTCMRTILTFTVILGRSLLAKGLKNLAFNS